jgi:6,7-dimethyl-8-ribityllumazine synthase
MLALGNISGYGFRHLDFRVTVLAMSKDAPAFSAAELPVDCHVAIVAARFNEKIVDELLKGCQARLAEEQIAGDRLEIHRVPGAFELPVAAKALADTKKFAAVICLGCVIRGDTPHFDYVAGEAARGIQQVAITTSLPIVFGVLTTNTSAQALDRLGGSHGHAGERAADAAMEMIALFARIKKW